MGEQCIKCGSDKLIPLVSVVDQGQHSDGTLKAHVGYTNPEAWLFRGSVYARLRATICGECGYTELTAENPWELYEAYLKARSQAPPYDHLKSAEPVDCLQCGTRIDAGESKCPECGWSYTEAQGRV